MGAVEARASWSGRGNVRISLPRKTSEGVTGSYDCREESAGAPRIVAEWRRARGRGCQQGSSGASRAGDRREVGEKPDMWDPRIGERGEKVGVWRSGGLAGLASWAGSGER